jgi:proline iminopeptidase
VILYDQRGAGLSQRVEADQLKLSEYLKELDAVVDYYGKGEPVRIIGHSWGAMLLSGYLGYAPEKVAKAVLAEPGFLNE